LFTTKCVCVCVCVCVYALSLSLSDSGCRGVFSWSVTNDSTLPSLVSVGKIASFHSLSCGYAHTALLANEGVRWQPQMHTTLPVAFQREVVCVLLAHCDARNSLSALPKEILFEIFGYLANLH
jgi:hypothetical protein